MPDPMTTGILHVELDRPEPTVIATFPLDAEDLDMDALVAWLFSLEHAYGCEAVHLRYEDGGPP